MNRRNVLRAAGIGVVLPMLESFRAPRLQGPPEPAVGDGQPLRFVAVGTFLGFHTPAMFPETAGPDYETTRLLGPLSDLRGDYTLVSGLDHNGPNGHNYWGTYLTGPQKHSLSIDQKLASALGGHTRFASLELSAGPPGAGMMMSVTKQGIALPMNYRVTELYSKLFGQGADQEHLAYVLDSNQSVLDFVLDDARALQRRASTSDREKLDEYFTSLRDVERKLTTERAWLDKPKPVVDYDPGDTDLLGPDQEFEVEEIMYDLMALALTTDSVRVISFFLPGLSPLFTIDGRRLVAGYHGLSHHNRDPVKINDLLLIEELHVKLFARFLRELKAKKDADGRPLLDTTIVLLGTGMGDASRHSNQNLPAIVAGGGFRHGSHFDYRSENGEAPAGGPVLSNLFVSFMQRLGLEEDAFANSNGDLNHVLL